MNKVYLSLGSNMGDKRGYLERAVSYLNEEKEITVTNLSSYYETAPVLYEKQDRFLNQVIELETNLTPDELLTVCHKVENWLNRKRIIRYGPRTIDLDILLFGDVSLNDETLTIPHPRIKERAFVLIPLYELNKNLIILDECITDLVNNIKKSINKDDIRKL